MSTGGDVERFDRRAPAYERGWRAEFHARVVERSAELALEAVPDPGTVLDVGCGTGALLRILDDRLPTTVQLVGVDPAPTMVEVAQAALREYRNARVETGFAESLDFPDASFDLVISTVSFHHWTNQGAGPEEVSRVLRPHARLVLVDHFATGWLRAFNAIARRNMRTRRELETLLASARLAPRKWAPIFDLGPLPLIQALVAEHAPWTSLDSATNRLSRHRR